MNEPLPLIITGAAGRMGHILTTLIQEEPNYALAGATDLKDKLNAISSLPCPVSDNLEEVLIAAPGAVVIDFTSASASLKNAEITARMQFPIVIGSTGIGVAQKKRLQELAKNGPILWSANMSIGINSLAAILPGLAAELGPAYDIEIMELHHKNKKDSPSGTALMLAETLATARNLDLEKARVSGRDGITGPRKPDEIGVQALRGGDVVGIHSVYFLGPGEFIEVTHHAQSRENFAQGALRAAGWLKNQKPGPLYSMQNVLSASENKPE